MCLLTYSNISIHLVMFSIWRTWFSVNIDVTMLTVSKRNESQRAYCLTKKCKRSVQENPGGISDYENWIMRQTNIVMETVTFGKCITLHFTIVHVSVLQFSKLLNSLTILFLRTLLKRWKKNANVVIVFFHQENNNFTIRILHHEHPWRHERGVLLQWHCQWIHDNVCTTRKCVN